MQRHHSDLGSRASGPEDSRFSAFPFEHEHGPPGAPLRRRAGSVSMALQRTARNEDQGGSLVWRLITEPATKFLITASAGVSRKSTAGRFAANDVPLGG